MFLLYWRAGTNWPKDKAGNGYGQSQRKIEKVKRFILLHNWFVDTFYDRKNSTFTHTQVFS